MIARYCECGRSLTRGDWLNDDYVCSGCSKLPKACGCEPLRAEIPPATMLSRLLPGGSVLDVPAVPPAVWGDDTDLLWAEGQSLIIAGDDGTGKTQLAGNLVRARLGLAGQVLGLPVTPGQRNVLYLAMDRPAQAMASLARLFTEADRDVLDARLRVWRGPPPADLARDPVMLTRLCALADADTCVADSLKDAAMRLSDDEAGQGWNTARQHLIESGTQLLELHHPRKAQGDNKKPRELADLYGSRFIGAGAGSVVMLWGKAGDPVVELNQIKPVIGSTAGPWQVEIRADGEVARQHAIDLLEQISMRGSNGMTATVAARLITGNDKPARNDTEKARRRLEKLTASGHLVKKGGGRGTEADYFPAARP